MDGDDEQNSNTNTALYEGQTRPHLHTKNLQVVVLPVLLSDGDDTTIIIIS